MGMAKNGSWWIGNGCYENGQRGNDGELVDRKEAR